MSGGLLDMNSLLQDGNSQQWVVLTIFFTIFAIAGLFNKPKTKQLEYFHFVGYGILIIIANLLVLALMNTSSDKVNLIDAVLLQKTSIQGSFIVFGYCLISRGLGQFIRTLFISKSYSSRIL